MFGKTIVRGLLALAMVSYAVVVQAASIDMVPVGDPGNAGRAFWHWRGRQWDNSNLQARVGYNYNIGKYEVTARQYTKFLNAVAKSGDTYGLYNIRAWPTRPVLTSWAATSNVRGIDGQLQL